MTSFYFGRPDRRLMGAYHAPLRESQPRTAALLCSPFGHEAIRAHRLYRVLAEQLSRAGVAALRFDPYGAGDSGGDDEDLEVGGWCRDVVTAHAELLARSGATAAAWIGVRLGATVALRASTGQATVNRLVLWDPVLDGRAYLTELESRQADAMRGYGTASTAVVTAAESLGFALSRSLVTQLSDLRPDALALPGTAAVHLLQGSGIPGLASFASAHPGVSTGPALEPFDWTSSEAMNTALVPMRAIQAIVALVKDLR